MAITFNPGDKYYEISGDDYDLISGFSNLGDDFQKADPDTGSYYALIGSIDDDEMNYMSEELGYIPEFQDYHKSTQSHSPI